MADKKGTDFYVIIDFKKMRGVRILDMEDSDGFRTKCAVIPLIKNGMKNHGPDKWRMILAARKSNRVENASHMLIPQCDKEIIRAMAAIHLTRANNRYIAPIVGDIVRDLSQIPCPPTFLPDTPIADDMEANRIKNVSGLAIDKDNKNELSELQVKLRNKLVKK